MKRVISWAGWLSGVALAAGALPLRRQRRPVRQRRAFRDQVARQIGQRLPAELFLSAGESRAL